MENLDEVGELYEVIGSPQFSRIFEVLECYQNLLAENVGDEKTFKDIKRRMHNLDDYNFLTSTLSEKLLRDNPLLNPEIKHRAIQLCEENTLTKEKLAEMFLQKFPDFLSDINPKPNDVDVYGQHVLNKAVAYFYQNGNINIVILPTAVKGTDMLISEIIDGFQTLAKILHEDNNPVIQKISMSSWLLGSAFEDKIKKIFGNDVEFVSENKERVVETSQRQALAFNKKSIENYLLTGELPEVRKLVMKSDDFIAKFYQQASNAEM